MNTYRWHMAKRATSCGTRARGLSIIVAMVVGTAIWLFARFVVGVRVMRPSLIGRDGSTDLGIAEVAVACLVVGLAAWALVAVLERRADQPRLQWITIGLVAVACSLGAPLSGHGVSGADRIVLVVMHLLVGGTIILGFAMSLSWSGESWRELSLKVMDQFISLPSRRRQES